MKKEKLAFVNRHPDDRLQATWNYAQMGFLALPLIPFVGILVLLFACGQTWRQQYRRILRRPLNWGLAIFSVLLVITAGLAYDRSAAFLGLFNFLPYFFVFVGYSALIQTPAQLRQWAWILVVTSVPVVFIGLGQIFWGWAGHLQFLWVVLDWPIEPTGNPPGRMSSIFMYANILAGYLVIVFSLGLGLWIEAYQTLVLSPLQERGRHRRHVSNTAWLRWGFLSVALIGNLVALILTDSRNAWVISVFAALAFALYQGWRWLVAGVAGIAGTILGAAFGPSPVQQWLRAVVPTFFWARLTDQLYPDRPVATLRKTQWQFAWSLTQQRPWTGWGLRNFTSLYEAHMHIWLGHPHNFLLMLTAETGIPFAVLFCGWVIWVVVQGVQLLRDWSISSDSGRQMARDRLIFFSYIIAFVSCIFFNTVDVTTFDARLNSLGWLVLSAICGVVYNRRANAYGK